MSSLDETFGLAIPPQNGGRRSWETGHELLRYELHQASARELSHLLVTAGSGEIGFRLASAVSLLWIVSESGEVIFALEETIDLNGPTRRPRMRGLALNGNVKPLGHPLLVGGAVARIGGELYVDRNSEGELILILNNRSGRYGLHKSRTENHLENVADLFRRYGLPIETDFVEIG